jgi:hypothetical protein
VVSHLKEPSKEPSCSQPERTRKIERERSSRRARTLLCSRDFCRKDRERESSHPRCDVTCGDWHALVPFITHFRANYDVPHAKKIAENYLQKSIISKETKATLWYCIHKQQQAKCKNTKQCTAKLSASANCEFQFSYI